MDPALALPLPETLAEAHAGPEGAPGELRAENAALRERAAVLEAQLGQNSLNSPRPPSTDPRALGGAPPPPAKREPSGRKPGGQPGDAAHQRPLLPPERHPQVGARRIVVAWPAQCRYCGVALPENPELVVAEPVRHQHPQVGARELPPVRIEVTEHQRQRLRCPGCGEETRAELPPGVPAPSGRGAFGPRLQAAAAVLSGPGALWAWLSRRSVVGVLADLHPPAGTRAEVAVGSVNALCQRPSAHRTIVLPSDRRMTAALA